MRIRMSGRTLRFDWNRARAFLVTAEEGSFSAAARSLGMSQPTVGRQVSALEEELGVVLFERDGRGLALTTSGLELLDHARAMGAAAGSLSLAAAGQADSVEGDICISATEVMAVFVLPRIIQKLRHVAPGIDLEVIASNSASNLKRREADIAIRGFRPTQPDLVARKLRDVDAYLYAAPSYLAELGNPASPSDFGEAEFIGFDGTDALLSLLNSRGFNLTRRNFPITAENSIVQWELVKHGAVIGIMPATVGEEEPAVRRALPGLEPISAELWIVAHREVKTSRRVRTVFDFLASELS
jgi:DNA-binding transcriptional LysR family regulator